MLQVNTFACLRMRDRLFGENSDSIYIFQIHSIFTTFVGKTWGFLADMLLSTHNKGIY